MRRTVAHQATLDLRRHGLTAGIDEAGRGPLAGPVVAAAVILDRRRPIRGIADSKALCPEVREELSLKIRERCIAFGLGWSDPCEIDAINILQATMLAMRRALLALRWPPVHVIVDGDRCPNLSGLSIECSIEAVVDGDANVGCVGAASIVAKVARDQYMRELCGRYPGYGFSAHKGYGTPEHLDALRRLGPSPVHRRSFAPVQSSLLVD
ncbi:MAG TPA: ribonuclease HII [Steroidobacteraceae bacterium]|nr:ribonuclease HII [Steroidobacteraceae bacterium]